MGRGVVCDPSSIVVPVMFCSLSRKLVCLALVGTAPAVFAQNEAGATEVDPPNAVGEGEEEEDELDEDDLEFRRRKAAYRPRMNYLTSGRCRFDWSLEPKRLMPGQTGLLKIMMVLESNAVMRSGSDLKASQREPAGSLSLGDLTLSPPRLSKLAKAYQGQPIYDDWALLEMPITMSSEAPMGSRQAAVVEAVFELHDGVSGTSMGSYHKLVRVQCEVGLAADPVVDVGGKGPSGPVARPDKAAGGAVAVESAKLAAPADAIERPPVTGQAASVDEEALPKAQPETVESPVAEESGSFLLVAGGLMAAVLLLLLIRRR